MANNRGSAAGFVAKRADHLLPDGRRWEPKRSAAGFAEKRPDHLPTEGRIQPPKGQPQVLQQRDLITYSLQAGDGHQSVSRRFATRRPDHLLPGGRRWSPQGQQRICNEWMVSVQSVYQK